MNSPILSVRAAYRRLFEAQGFSLGTIRRLLKFLASRGRSGIVSKDQEKQKDAGWWRRDKAAIVESLATEMTVPEAKKEMEAIAGIYRRIAERRASRASSKRS
jgi:hypothetical protein